MEKPSKEEERENMGTVRLTSDNWDAVWDEVAKQRKAGGRPSFNSVMNGIVTCWREKKGK